MSRVPPSVLRKPATVLTTASSIALFGLPSRRSQRAVDLNSTAKSSSLAMISSTVRSAAPPGRPSCSATSDANSASVRIRSTTLSAIDAMSGAASAATPAPVGRRSRRRSPRVDAGAVVAVGGDDVVEDGLDLGVEELGRVGVCGQVGVEDVDGSSRARRRSWPPCGASPARACRAGARAAAWRWPSRRRVRRRSSAGSGLVSRSKIASSSSVSPSATARCSSSVSVLRQLDEAAQVLVDVEAAGVVLGDQLLDPLDQVVARRVAGCRRDGALLQQRRETVGLGALAAGELGGERVEVDLGQVDERVRLAAFGRGPDDVLLGARRTGRAARRPRRRSQSRSALGGRDTSAMRSASTRMAATVCCCAAACGSGSRALNSLRTWRAAARNVGASLLVDQQRLDGGVPQRDVRETRARRAVASRSTPLDAQNSTTVVDRARPARRRARRRPGSASRHRLGVRGAVDRERLLEVPEHADVVDDQPVVLVGEHPVGAGDRLHQRVVAHRPVEVDRRHARRVEAGHPHRADEHQPQRIVRRP